MANPKTITRKAAMKHLGMLYKRAPDIDLSVCVYCGDPRQCLDHVPPLSYVHAHVDIKKFLEDGGKLLYYPACNQCNQMLGSKPLVRLIDRLCYLEKKYLRLADKTEWSDSDMAELGRNMLQMIANHEFKRRRNSDKLAKVIAAIASCEE